MKRTITLLALSLMFLATYAQKEKSTFTFDKRTDTYSDASGVLFTLEKTKSTSTPGMHNFYFNSKDGKHLIFVVYSYITRIKYMNKNNPDGKMPFYTVNFIGANDQKCEIRYYESLKNMGELFYDKKLIVNGELNMEAVKTFIMESGNAFTAN